MNVTRFIANFKEAFETLKPFSHSTAELNKLCLEIAVKLEELEYRDREISILELKTRQEMELGIITLRNQNVISQAEALKSLIQAESMARSVVDNAAINKASAFVGYLNVIANAQNASAANNSASIVKNCIDLINTDNIAGLEKPFADVKALLEKLGVQGSGARDVYIYTPRLELKLGERVKILGFSSYGNNDCVFFIAPYENSSLYEKIKAARETIAAYEKKVAEEAQASENATENAENTENSANSNAESSKSEQTTQDAQESPAEVQLPNIDEIITNANAKRYFTKTLIYEAKAVGRFEVIFESQNDDGAWAGESVLIEVRDFEAKE